METSDATKDYAMIKKCECCEATIGIEEDDPDIILEPFPHIECPSCGEIIPVF